MFCFGVFFIPLLRPQSRGSEVQHDRVASCHVPTRRVYKMLNFFKTKKLSTLEGGPRPI